MSADANFLSCFITGGARDKRRERREIEEDEGVTEKDSKKSKSHQKNKDK